MLADFDWETERMRTSGERGADWRIRLKWMA
jgi:hypothetical protein